jgi:hypothetical protein
MTAIISIMLTVLLTTIALLHFYWAAGGLWPGQSATELAAIVVGRPGMRAMPSMRLSVLVAVILAGFAAWPFVLSPLVSRFIAPQLAVAGSVISAAVFLLRGVAGYTSAMTRRHSAEPFASYNRILYSPICLLIGAGFLVLALNGETA